MRPLLLAAILVFASSSAHAQVYKWVDAQGKVHFSDQPPPGAVQAPSATPAAPSATASQPKSYVEKEMEFRKRRIEAEEARKKQEDQIAETRVKQQNCVNAKGNLKNLEDGGRVFEYNDKGERVFLNDNARQQAIREARQAVDSWCK